MTASMPSGYPRFTLRRGEEGYPASFEEIPDPPAELYGIGVPSALSREALAIVGARRATPYGLGCARLFGGHAAAEGLVVVSGGAVGCDQEAARSALDAGGVSVAVLGGAADVVYPAGALRLLCDIVEAGGAVISEHSWGTPPLRGFFVRRNRLIAGLCRATLIVEAGLPSGTFSTADAALAAGREVLVVPGNIHSPQSLGSNRLLFQGAQPIIDLQTFDEVVAGIYGLVALQAAGGRDVGARSGVAGADADRCVVLDALRASPMRLDQLAAAVELPRERFVVTVAECESSGLIERGRDGRYHVPVS